jgi:hypothetical protein
MVRVEVAGNKLTEVGLMLQLPAPYVVGQLRMTVPLNPSCEVIEIVPVVPVLPAFTSGKVGGKVRSKSGFAVTFNVNEVVRVEGAPGVVAWMVTG